MKNRKRNRLVDFDYSSDNLYFITSCTKDKVCCFGEINNGNMILNEMGYIAEQQWQWLLNQYTYIESHAFVVMPNHIHGILEINGDARTGHDLSLPKPKIKSLSELISAYKTTTSKKIHLLDNNNFAWQRSFYDHVIRNTKSYEKIFTYILNNPLNWDEDMFNEISI